MTIHRIDHGAVIVSGDNIAPGDTLEIVGGSRGRLSFNGLAGTADQPIVIRNVEGSVTIAANAWCGLYLVNCHHVHLAGTGDANIEYGFKITGFTNCGLMLEKRSEYIEADHVFIYRGEGAHSAGVRCETKLTDAPAGYVMRGVHFHEIWIHDVQTEGFYIGNYADVARPMSGIEIDNCTILNAGYDGIQLKGQVEKASIHNNHLENIGTRAASAPGQACAALQAGHGTWGEWYGNTIINAHRGMEFDKHGAGCSVHHNLIAHSGFHGGQNNFGILQWTSRAIEYYHNTIVDSKQSAIYCPTSNGELRDCLIVQSGEKHINGNLPEHHNVFLDTIAEARFVDPEENDYHLLEGSPAIGAASDGGDCGLFPYEDVPPPPPPLPQTPRILRIGAIEISDGNVVRRFGGDLEELEN